MRQDVLIDPFVLLLFEGYGKTSAFGYDNWGNDPEPRILQLGQYVHPSTKNTLVAGINLNYLTPDQVRQLQYYLPEILSNKNLKARYWAGRKLLPGVFTDFYRTYDRSKINVVQPGTLKFLNPKELEKQGDVKGAKALQARRDKLNMMKSKQLAPRKPAPQPVPQVPPDAIQTQVASPQTTQGRAAEVYQSKQADRMISKIDQRTAEAPPEPLEPTVAPPQELEPKVQQPPVPKPDMLNADPEEITDEDLPPRPQAGM